jgi:nucleoside-diphosphate-sugar epimerase
MPALVTGASGFLGGRLAQALVSRGEQVTVLARAGADLGHLHRLPLEVVAGTLSDVAALAKAVRGVTHIYHCAACSSDWAPWRTFHEANVTGVHNLLAAAATVPTLRRFLHVSTTDIYGYPRVPCDESHPSTDVGLPYNSTKIGGENWVRQAALKGLPITIVRPATIYGPRGKEFVVNIAKHLRTRTMAVIDGGRSAGGFAYVDNVVDAMISAAMSPATIDRAYNIVDGTGTSWRAYVAALADGLREHRPWIDLPSAAAWPLAWAMEAVHATLHLPGRPLLTRHAVLLLSRDQEFPSGAARRDFNFAPKVSLSEGISRTVEWLASPRRR